MSNSIHFDPKSLVDLEPSEGDERNGNWISPFGVPQGIQIWNDEFEKIRCIEFEYSGGEAGKFREPLDDRIDPPIQVFLGRQTKKIIQLNFGSSITESDFPNIAERLQKRAGSAKTIGIKLNHIMISKIFSNWSIVTERIS